jgi:PPM family protein phosphatase
VSQLHAAGATDTGQIRQGNEDSYLLGESVFAVADGMGGHLAGEVASATALEPVAELDGRVFADPDVAREAIATAVEDANRAVSSMASAEPAYRGMGTTLTSAMLEGRRLHLAHVGDSRAYLLRDGDLQQITTDHTLVQHLIDEGQISREEAASHPQRSIITRAIGVSPRVEVDAVSIELVDGDVLLLCSDGLTGVVPDDAIAAILGSGHDLDQITQTLIARANEAGGPDNITVVVLRYGETDERMSGAAGHGEPRSEPSRRVAIRPDANGDDDGDWAGRLGRLGALGRDHEEPSYATGDTDDGSRSLQRVGIVIISIVALVAVSIAGGRWLLSRSYFVGLQGERVVIFQGIPTDVGPFDLSWKVEDTDLTTTGLPDYYIDDLEDGIGAIDLADARRIVDSARELRAGDGSTADGDAEPTPEPTATATP